ncbi:hypothetical protein GGI42DRAFT_321207 [Trichoderma sp. SZMC 28013]
MVPTCSVVFQTIFLSLSRAHKIFKILRSSSPAAIMSDNNNIVNLFREMVAAVAANAGAGRGGTIATTPYNPRTSTVVFIACTRAAADVKLEPVAGVGRGAQGQGRGRGEGVLGGRVQDARPGQGGFRLRGFTGRGPGGVLSRRQFTIFVLGGRPALLADERRLVQPSIWFWCCGPSRPRARARTRTRRRSTSWPRYVSSCLFSIQQTGTVAIRFPRIRRTRREWRPEIGDCGVKSGINVNYPRSQAVDEGRDSR